MVEETRVHNRQNTEIWQRVLTNFLTLSPASVTRWREALLISLNELHVHQKISQQTEVQLSKI